MTSQTIYELTEWFKVAEPSLSQNKRLLIMKAANELKRLSSEVELLMVVKDEYDSEIKRLAKELGSIAPLDDLE